jgi:hypothetical protein
VNVISDRCQVRLRIAGGIGHDWQREMMEEKARQDEREAINDGRCEAERQLKLGLVWVDVWADSHGGERQVARDKEWCCLSGND